MAAHGCLPDQLEETGVAAAVEERHTTAFTLADKMNTTTTGTVLSTTPSPSDEPDGLSTEPPFSSSTIEEESSLHVDLTTTFNRSVHLHDLQEPESFSPDLAFGNTDTTSPSLVLQPPPTSGSLLFPDSLSGASCACADNPPPPNHHFLPSTRATSAAAYGFYPDPTQVIDDDTVKEIAAVVCQPFHYLQLDPYAMNFFNITFDKGYTNLLIKMTAANGEKEIALETLEDFVGAINSNPAMCLIQGAPASGKTILTERIEKTWGAYALNRADHASGLEKYVLALPIWARRLSMENDVDEELWQNYGDGKYTLKEDFLEMLRQLGNSLLLIVDGIDEIIKFYDDEPSKKKVFDGMLDFNQVKKIGGFWKSQRQQQPAERVEAWFKANRNRESLRNLLFGKSFPRAKIVVTSRVNQDIDHLFPVHMKILGFSPENSAKYMEIIIMDLIPHEWKEYYDSLQEAIKNNRRLQDFIWCPLFCCFFCLIWIDDKDKLLEVGENLSEFEILSYVVESFFTWKFKREAHFEASGMAVLCQFAFNMLGKGKLDFTDEDIKKMFQQQLPFLTNLINRLRRRSTGAEAAKQLIDSQVFMVGFIERVYNTGLTYKFLHVNFVEFLAAKHVAVKFDEIPPKKLRPTAARLSFYRYSFGMLSEDHKYNECVQLLQLCEPDDVKSHKKPKMVNGRCVIPMKKYLKRHVSASLKSFLASIHVVEEDHHLWFSFRFPSTISPFEDRYFHNLLTTVPPRLLPLVDDKTFLWKQDPGARCLRWPTTKAVLSTLLKLQKDNSIDRSDRLDILESTMELESDGGVMVELGEMFAAASEKFVNIKYLYLECSYESAGGPAPYQFAFLRLMTDVGLRPLFPYLKVLSLSVMYYDFSFICPPPHPPRPRQSAISRFSRDFVKKEVLEIDCSYEVNKLQFDSLTNILSWRDYFNVICFNFAHFVERQDDINDAVDLLRDALDSTAAGLGDYQELKIEVNFGCDSHKVAPSVHKSLIIISDVVKEVSVTVSRSARYPDRCDIEREMIRRPSSRSSAPSAYTPDSTLTCPRFPEDAHSPPPSATLYHRQSSVVITPSSKE